MKLNLNSQRWLPPVLVGLGLAASTMVLAEPDRVLGTFDAGLEAWGRGWGSATTTFDAVEDNTGNGGGSCYIAGDYAADQNALNVYGCISGNPWWHPDPAINLTLYKSVEFDIKWDPASTLALADFNANPGGDPGIAIWNSFDGNNWPTIGGVTIPSGAATGWAHISLPINPAIANLDVSYGIMLKKWVTSDTKTAGGTFGFWVDNVTLKGTDAPPPPPTVTLQPHPVPGLAFIAASGGQYDRQNIRTVGNNYSWIGAPGLVSYSINVAKHADIAGFQLHMHLVPGTPDPARPDSDWHEPNVLMWRIGNNADGSAWSDLRYKTNAPDNNGHLWDTGALGGVGNPTPTGNWTLTFSQDTNVTITAPDGGTLVTNLPPEVIEIFKATPTMQLNVGVVPGELSRLGQKVTLNGVKITGTPGEPNLDSNFVGLPLDTSVWSINASSANYGVQSIGTDAAGWLTWTLPAAGFSLQTKATLGAGAWSDPTVGGYDAGGNHYALIKQADLPGTSAGFFRLIKRVFTKLQVLMPGETAAPGTASGKTGTPIAQQAGVPFDVIVNAVDEAWHVVATTDMIQVTSSDELATLPANAALNKGTATFSVTFGSGGTWTITATDVSDATKTPNTGSPTVAN